MSFWKRLNEGFWRLSLPRDPPKLRPGSESGTLDDGKKHGLWVERSKNGNTLVLFYDHGKKHGPFRDYYATGERRTEGTHFEGELDGSWRTWHRNGVVAGTARFDRGKLEGMHRMFLPSGEVKLESEYIHNKAHGPWRLLHDDGTPHQEGAHDLGLRVGLWKLYDERGQVREEGHYDAGERDGTFTFSDERGAKVLVAGFSNGIVHGPFQVLRGGKPIVEGSFNEGVIDPRPRFAENARSELVAHPPPEPVVREWVELESALSVLAPQTELPKTFVSLGDDPDPVDDAEYARQVESHEAWITLFTVATKLHAGARAIVAERVRERLAKRTGALLPEVGYPPFQHLVGSREPHPLARHITTICLDHAHFDDETSPRFRERFAKQLRRLSLFECTFDPGLDAFLRKTTFEALEVLEIADYDRKGRGLGAVLELPWAERLVRLAFDGTEARYDDAATARVFEAERLKLVRSLSLGAAELGPLTERAIENGGLARRLRELSFVSSEISPSVLECAAASMPHLQRLGLDRCKLTLESRAAVEAWAARARIRLSIVDPDD